MLFRIFVLVAVLSLFHQLEIAAQMSPVVKHFTRQDYSGGHQNWSLDTDRNGFLYAANNNGLLKFDGSRWTTHTDSSLYILRSVMVSNDGRIYTGSYEEFGYWQKNEKNRLVYHSLKGLLKNFRYQNNEIWKIVELNGKVYFQSFSSLFVYDRKTVHSIDLPGNVLFLLQSGNRLFIQVLGKGLYELVNDQFRNIDPEAILAKTEVKTIMPVSDSLYLIGTTSDGLFLYDNRTIAPWKVPAEAILKQFQINNGLVMGKQFVFGTIVGGVVIMDASGNVVNHLDFENALQNNTVLSMCLDRSGSLWLGLDRGIDNIAFSHPVTLYNAQAGLIGAVYTAALVGNRLYVGTNRGVFTYLHQSGTFRYEGMVPNSQGQVWQLKVIDESLFCGHTNGTYLIEGVSMKKICDVTGGFAIEEFNRNSHRYLIQSTYSPLVIYEKMNNTWTFSHIVQGYIEPSRFLETDHLDNIWVSHAIKGLYKLKLDTGLQRISEQRKFGRKEGLPSDFDLKVFKVANRVVFTTGSKLFTWDDVHDKMIPLDELNRNLSGFESAKAIANAGNNRYWFIRKNDIALFELTGFKPKMLYRMLLPLYNISMPDNYESVVPLDTNLSLICLDNGFAIFDLRNHFSEKGNDVKLLWGNCYSSNSSDEIQPLGMDSENHKLAFNYNTVTFSFSLLNSPAITKQYQYRLEGIDTGWSSWTDKAEVKYTRLPHGQYRFWVRSISSTGTITEPLEYAFYIRRPWYASIMAWSVYSVLTFGLILAAFYLYRKRILRQHERIRREHLLQSDKERQMAEQEIITLQNQNLQAEISHKNIQLADSTISVIRKNELLIEIKNELLEQKEVLGHRYPTRYFEKITRLIDKNISNDNDWKLFESLFDQAHENFFKRLKASYPDLTQSDLKLCAYLKLNLSSKEIAPLLNISIRGVEIRRYRLRKRLGLSTDHNLVDFIMQI